MPTPLSTSGLHVKLGYTGTGTMSPGSNALTAVGFTALPWQGSGTPFTAPDIGTQISVIGAGASMPFVPAFGPVGKMLVSTVASVVSGASCTLADTASNNTQPGAANVVIYRKVSTKAGSIKISWNITSIARSTLSFTVESRNGSMVATAGMPVLVYHDTLGVMWGGSIHSVKCTNATAFPGDMLTFEITCNSWAVLLDRRLMSPYILTGGVFSSRTLRQVTESLVYDYCDSEGLEVDSIVGPTIDLDVSGRADKSIAQALDIAMTKCNDATHAHVWYVSPWKVVTVKEALTNNAPWHISDADASEKDVLVSLDFETSREKLANHVYLEAGLVLGPSTTESFTGNGTTEDWAVTKPIGAIPALTVNGVTQTVGIKNGTTTFEWYWILGGNAIVRGTHAILTSSQTLAIAYRPTSSQIFVGRDSTAIDRVASIESGTGQWDIKQSYSVPLEVAAGQAAADSVTAQFSEVPQSLLFETYKPLLDIAQIMTVTLAQFVLGAAKFLIDTVDLMTDENQLKWSVHCVKGPLVGDYVTAFIAMTSGGDATGGGISSGASRMPDPAAPNITSATAAPTYGLLGTTSVFGFSGMITLPTTDPNYGHLAEIIIEAVPPGATGGIIIARILAANFGASTVAYSGGQFLQTGTGASWSLRFTAFNEFGTNTVPPVTVTSIAINASAITAVTGAEHGSSRYADPTTRLVHLLVDIACTINASQVPQTAMTWISSDNGITFVPIGWARITTVGQVIQWDRLVPGAAQTWKVAAAAGAIDYVGGVAIPAASLPAGTVISAGFAVAGLAVPAASNGITATIAAAATAKYTSDGTAYGYVAPISYTDPTGTSTDFFVRVTVQDYDSGGTALGPEKPHMGTQITGAGNVHTNDNPLLITYYSGLHHIKVRIYVANRVSQNTGDFSNAGTNTLQNVSFNGGGATSSFDISITIPAGALDLTRSDANSVGYGLTKDPTTSKLIPGTDNNTNMFQNPGFEINNLDQWTPDIAGTGYFNITTFATNGGLKAATLGGSHGGGYQRFSCRPNEQLFIQADQYGFSGSNGVCQIYVRWLDGTKTSLGLDVASGDLASKNSAFHRVALMVTAPAGAAYADIYPAFASSNTSGFYIVDNAFCARQTPSGPGTTPDGNGGVKLGTSNLSNLVMNPGFEDGVVGTSNIPHWTTTAGSWLLQANPSAFAGANVLLNNAPNSAMQGESIACRPGDLLYVEAFVLFSTGGGSTGTIDVVLDTYDASGALVGSPTFIPAAAYPAATEASASNLWLKINANATVPAGVSSVRPRIHAVTATGAGIWLVDNVFVGRQPSTGPGSEPDGFGGSQAKLAAPLTFLSNQIALALLGVSTAYLAAAAVDATKMAANAVTAANGALAANAVVDNNVANVGVAKLIAGTTIFTGDVFLSRGSGNPVIALQNTGMFLYSVASGSTGLTGSPYVAIQSSGIGVFSGGNPSVTINSSSVNLWSVNGNTSNPYVSLSSSSITIQASNFTTSISASQIQLSHVSGATLTLNTSAVTILNGSYSVTINATSVVISNGSNSMTLNSSNLTLVGSTGNVVIGSGGLVVTFSGFGATTILGQTVFCFSLDFTASVGTINFSSSRSTTSASTGFASALPANPAGYMDVNVAGAARKMPYYFG